jgi:hypothetical protein
MMLNIKRVYALLSYTAGLRARGWFFWDTYSGSHAKGPYRSMASVTLMVARELLREITRRDAPKQLPN